MGTPDVNYIEGWIELKKIDWWPKRADSIVRVEHYTPQQRIWSIERSRKGGRVHLLLQVGRADWLLFDGRVAADHLGRVDRRTLESLALRHWRNGLPPGELRATLRLHQQE